MPIPFTQHPYILKIAITIPVHRLFDYLPPDGFDPDKIKPGMRVEVPFGKGKKIGFLMATVKTCDSSIKLKQAVAILDSDSLLSSKELTLLTWAAGYYHHPVGEVVATAFPAGLRQGKPAALPVHQHYHLTAEGRTEIGDNFKRAPAQQVMLRLFQESDRTWSEAALAERFKRYRTPLKQLLAKKMIQAESSVSGFSSDSIPAQAILRQPALSANPAQQQAIADVCASLNRFNVFVLAGVTGSGKTEVYLQIIQQVLERDRQVLILLPEINLTPQLEQRFKQRFNTEIALSHSKLSDSERQFAWLKMQQGRCTILLGTRSALFTPLSKPGLIILDEEHDGSFKQQEGFRFSARDVAIMRAKLLEIPIVLGSATPALETLYNIKKKRFRLLELPERAGSALPPVLHLLDIRNKPLQEGLAQPLLEQMTQTLAKGEQVLLFLNRRGFAPVLICHGCGWVARCRRCETNLVVHSSEQVLRCHHCSQENALPKACPGCQTGNLIPLGLGTERVEQALKALFPENRVIRLDRDSTQRKGALEYYLNEIQQNRADIILGTQMLAKGHHFPNVTLVGLIDVDSGLFSTDFHGPEKLAQLIVQVAGRAGRADKPGTVLLQTRRPEHPLLTALIRHGYWRFAEMALLERKQAALPPFSYQALIRAQAINKQAPQLFLQAASRLAQSLAKQPLSILGPVPAPMVKRAGVFRFQLLLQSPKRASLHALLKQLMPALEELKAGKKVRWSLDIDPMDLS
jgi:primosomal protein N' (replication factor Y)